MVVSTTTKPLTSAEAARLRLEAKFGKELLADGTTTLPNMAIDSFAAVGITKQEFAFWCVVVRFQYNEDLPWPSIDLIAQRLGCSYRTVERYIRKMEGKGLLRVIRGERKSANGYPINQYDFMPLYDKIVAFRHNQNITGESQNITGGAVKPPGKPAPPDTMSGKSASSSSKSSTKASTKMSLEESKEESKQESFDDSIDSKDDFDQEKLNGKNGHHSPSSEQPTVKEAVVAPVACTNVPQQADNQAHEWPLAFPFDETADYLSRRFGNEESLKSNRTTLWGLYCRWREHGLDAYDFDALVNEEVLKVSSARVTKRNPDGSPNRMSYFFTCMRTRLQETFDSLQSKEKGVHSYA